MTSLSMFTTSLLSFDWPAFALEVALKATVLIALAAAVHLALRRASAAARHWVWSVALGGVLVLPAALLLLPHWSVRGLSFPATTWSATRTASPAAGEWVAPALEARHAATGSILTFSQVADGTRSKATLLDERNGQRHQAGERVTPRPDARSQVVRSAPTPLGTSWPAGAWIAFAWLAGTIAVLGSMIAGRLGLGRIARHARPVDDDGWRVLAAGAARRLGVARDVLLLESDRTLMPMTWGIARPVVLLPSVARAWDPERLRVVLLHELAHVHRRDCLTQALAQLACASLWFHPAVWYAAARLRAERERACDDHVLNADTRASDYADHLLGVVRALRGALEPIGALAFARPSQFEGRLVALLDPRRSRGALRPAAALRITVISACLLLALAALKPWASPAIAGQPQAKHGERHALRQERLIGGPSRLLRAPDPSRSLESRWNWALAQADQDSPDGDFWIGYLLPSAAGEGDGKLCDSEGINISLLDDDYRGPLLGEALEGRADSRPAREKRRDGQQQEQLAILLHVGPRGSNEGGYDRIRAQTLLLPAELGRQPLFWLGEAGDEQSVAWLRRLGKQMPNAPLAAELVSVIGMHASDEIVMPYLKGVLESRAAEDVRSQAAEMLAGHPTRESYELLARIARDDRSLDVRLNAIESLGRLGQDEAYQVLLEIARSRSEDSEVRRAAVEALGRRASEKTAITLEDLATPAITPEPPVGPTPAPNDLSDTPDVPDVLAPESPTPPEMGETPEPAQAPEDVLAPERMKTKEWMKKRDARRDRTRQRTRVIDFQSEPEPSTDTPEAEPPYDQGQVDVQRQAVESLGRMGEEVSLPRLKIIAKTHPIADVRRQATESIGAIGTDGALGVLLELAWHGTDAEVQRQATESFGRFPEEKVASHLMDIARSHPRLDVRRQAIETLARFESLYTVTFLGEMAERSPYLELQRQAVESLARLPKQWSVPRLVSIAKSHPHPDVRRQAIESLSREDPEQALPLIEEILKAPKKRM